MIGLNLEGVREGQQGIETLSPCVESVAWEKRSDEPLAWFNRFERYRLLGPQRSLEAASQRCAEVEGQRCPKSSRTWCDASRRWQWQERARAWDATQPSPLPGEEEAHRSDARQERLGMISKIVKDLYVTLNLADLPNLEPDEARQFLPTLRLFFRDMLAAHRTEMGDDENSGHSGQIPTYTADDLVEAAKRLRAWRATTGRAANGDTPSVATPAQLPHATLLVVIGADASLRIDLAALRKVKRQTGLGFHRLTDASTEDLDAYLRRERSCGRPVSLLHLAVHAGHEGVQLADGEVDGEWLSERLLGVQVLLLAGCQGDRIGDWLGVVPFVITIDAAIGHDDAAVLCEHFWMGIGQGLAPNAALDAALAACAPVVAEYVVRHW